MYTKSIIDTIANKDLMFCMIRKCLVDKDQNQLLYLLIWEELKGLDLNSYMLKIPINDAMDLFRKLKAKNVPGNYVYLKFGNTESISSVIKKDENLIYTNDDSSEPDVQQIKIRLPETSHFHTLYKLIRNNVQIGLEFDDTIQYRTLNDVVLNRKNCNLSFRFKKDDGTYCSRFLEAFFFKPQLPIRALTPVVGLEVDEQWEIGAGGYFYNTITTIYEEISYNVFRDGIKLPQNDFFATIDFDILIVLFGRLFDAELFITTLKALLQVQEQQNQTQVRVTKNAEWTRTSAILNYDMRLRCLVEPYHKQPKSSDLRNIFLAYQLDTSFDRLDEVKQDIQMYYDTHTANCINYILDSVKQSSIKQSQIIEKTNLKHLIEDSSILTLICCILKNTLAHDKLFSFVFGRVREDPVISSAFNYQLRIQI